MTGDQSSDAFPRIAGDFRLLRELGRGGMGVVYKAEELASGRSVALKVLSAELSVSGEAFERFRREARIAASISDSRCVFVYGAHDIAGQPAISMELCEGSTLQDEIQKGEAIPIAKAVRWTLDMLEGLEAAQRSDVLHRDVKPSNCFLTADGTVKIGDFGLSRTFERDVQLTQSGQFLGSPLYASPEQIRGRAVDARSDQYSAAATLYALLTGRPPYTGSNLGEVLARILSEPAQKPRSLRPEIPSGLEKVVLRAMERDPDKRFKDFARFREALAPYVTSEVAAGSPLKRLGAYLFDSALLGLIASTSLAWGGFAQLGMTEFDRARPWMVQSLLSQLLTSLVPFFYFTLCEGWRGATLGKWLFGLRVVASATGEPSLSRAALRTLVFEGLSVVALVLSVAISNDAMELSGWSSLTAIVIVAGRFATARRANGWRCLHEILSGTRVVKVRSPLARFQHDRPPPSAAIARTSELLPAIAAYTIDGELARATHERWLAARDTELGRAVWIHERDASQPSISDARRALARPSRLRWLASVPTDRLACDTYEAPGGASLDEVVERDGPLPWPVAVRNLASLVEELEHEARAGATHGSTEQVWIDRFWNVRWLDAPLVPERARLIPLVDVVSEAARTMLVGTAPSAQALPSDLPVHGETLVRRLLRIDRAFESLAELRTALADCRERTPAVTQGVRGSQLGLALALPALATLVAIAIATFVVLYLPAIITTGHALPELRSGERSMTTRNVGDEPAMVALSDEGRRARQILLVDAAADPVIATMFSAQAPEGRAVLDDALRAHPALTAEDVTWARRIVEAEGSTYLLDQHSSPARAHHVWVVSVASFLVFGVLSSIVAFALRNPLSFALFGLRVRSRGGRRASRARVLLRSLAAWMPAGVLYALAAIAAAHERQALAWMIFVPVLTLHIWVVAQSIWAPSRGPLDRLFGMRVVPR